MISTQTGKKPIIIGNVNGRDRILAASGHFFGRRPYVEVSIAPILAEAEVQPPTLYHHFGDKEGLYVAWAHLAFAPLRTQLRIQRGATLEESLIAYAAIYFMMSGIDIQQVVRDIEGLTRDSSKEAVYGSYFEAIYEPLCAILIEGMDSGRLPQEAVGRLADLFLAGLNALSAHADKDSAGTAAWFVQRYLHGHRRSIGS